MSKKAAFIEGTTLQLDLWGDQFSAIEKQIDHAPRSHRELRKRLVALRRTRRRLRRRVREAAHDARSDWSELRQDLEEALEAFRHRAGQVYDTARRL